MADSVFFEKILQLTWYDIKYQFSFDIAGFVFGFVLSCISHYKKNLTCLMMSLPCIWFARIKGRGGAPGTGTAPASWAWKTR